MRTQLTFAITSRLVILDLKPMLSMTLCYSNSSRSSISQIGWQCKRPHLRVGTLPPTSGEVVLPLYLLSSWLRAYRYLTLAPFPVQQLFRSYLVAQLVKNPSAMQGAWVQPLGWEDPLEKGKATHSSILAWRIPWTLQPMGSQSVGHDWATFTTSHWPGPFLQLFFWNEVTFIRKQSIKN